MVLRSINPYTNEVIKEFEEYSETVADQILLRSAEAFNDWKRTGFGFRSSLLEKAAILLRRNLREYAGAITSEMGKPLKESKLEIEKCAWVCQYYAENAERFLSPEPVSTDADESFVKFEPLGTILGIMPWNFPFWQVFRFAVPALMAGNTILLKHASNVQICAMNIENIFSESGFPAGVFRNLVMGSSGVVRILKHGAIKGISLTGSESAGQKVAETAGNLIKKSVLELGGSNAFVVLQDADLKKAVETGIKARFQNGGQSCIAAKRFIIERKISEEFIKLFHDATIKLKVGDPTNMETDMGPLVSIQQAEQVEEQVVRSVELGARIIAGGVRNKAFYQPTVVIDVKPGMPLFDEEVFGPVAPFTIADSPEEAVSLANSTNFGLGVSLFTNDIEKAKKLVSEFQDGAVFINGLVKSDPRLPFGGTKRSGYGRELAEQGIREFVNAKTVWIKRL